MNIRMGYMKQPIFGPKTGQFSMAQINICINLPSSVMK